MKASNESRVTISFYRYWKIENVEEFRDTIFEGLEKLGVLGRIYVAEEGINAQISGLAWPLWGAWHLQTISCNL